jgi:hypothetical protein
MVFFRSPRLPGSTQRRPMLFLWFIFLILSIYALAPIYILFKEFPTATEHQKQLNLIGSETEKSSNEGGELMSRIDGTFLCTRVPRHNIIESCIEINKIDSLC